MPIVSFAQNFEDVVLQRVLGDVEKGCYLDVGAQDPVIDSVSLAFYHAGWRGVHVEPTPFYADLLREARPDETIIQAAVSDANGLIPFFQFEGTGISTGVPEIAASHRGRGYQYSPIFVPTIRLDQIFNMMGETIHWLKIDVEGMELAVLKSWGSSDCRPWVLLIEATEPMTQISNDSHWINEVIKRGYNEVYYDGLSRFFVHNTRKDLTNHFHAPPNVFDGFCIGKNHFAASYLQEEADRLKQAQDEETTQQRNEITRLHEVIQVLRSNETKFENTQARARLELEAIEIKLSTAISDRVETETARRTEAEHADSLQKEYLAKHEQMAEDLRRAIASGDAARVEFANLRQSVAEDKLAAVQENLASRESAWRERLEFEVVLRHEYQQREEQGAEALRVALRSDTAARVELARTQEQLDQTLQHMQRAEAERVSLLSSLAASQNLALNADTRADVLGREMRDQVNEAVARGENVANRLNSELSRTRAQLEQILAERSRVNCELDELKAKLDSVNAELLNVDTDFYNLNGELHEAHTKLRKVNLEFDNLLILYESLTQLHQNRWRILWRFLITAKPTEAVAVPGRRPSPAKLSQEFGGPDTTDLELGFPMPHTQCAEHNPYLRSDTLSKLLSWDDREFVQSAYVTLLGRQPDRRGEDHYSALLRLGFSKLGILRQIRNSPEGASHDPGIAGLDRALRRAHWQQRRVVGIFVRIFTNGEANDLISRRHRAVLNEFGRARIAQRAFNKAVTENSEAFESRLKGLLQNVEYSVGSTQDEFRREAKELRESLNHVEVVLKLTRRELSGLVSDFEMTEREWQEGIAAVLRSTSAVQDALKQGMTAVMTAQNDLAADVLRFMSNFEDALKPRPEDRAAVETRLTPVAQRLYNRLVSR